MSPCGNPHLSGTLTPEFLTPSLDLKKQASKKLIVSISGVGLKVDPGPYGASSRKPVQADILIAAGDPAKSDPNSDSQKV